MFYEQLFTSSEIKLLKMSKFAIIAFNNYLHNLQVYNLFLADVKTLPLLSFFRVGLRNPFIFQMSKNMCIYTWTLLKRRKDNLQLK